MNILEEKMKLHELVDIFAILADEMKLHEQAQLFTKDGVLKSINASNQVFEFHGREKIEKSCTNFMNLFQIHFHNNGQAVFEIEDEEHAHGTAYNITVLIGKNEAGEDIMTTNGIVYHDKYQKVDGEWKIARRESNFLWTKQERYVK